MTNRDYRIIRTEDMQKVWHPFFLTDVVKQAREERAARIGSDNWDRLTDEQKLNAYMGVLMSASRRVTVVIGDYSGDGHEQFGTYTVEISGADVSDAALRKSFSDAVDASGINPYDLLSDYEESSIGASDWVSLREVWERGAPARAKAEEANGSGMFSEAFFHDGIEEDALALVMAYVGFSIADFSWRVVPHVQSIFGGWSPVIANVSAGNVFGYGLFHG